MIDASSLPTRTIHVEADDPEELAGVQPERRRRFDQLGRGRFWGDLVEVGWGAAALQVERWSCGVRVRCDRPTDYVAFAVIQAAGDARWCGVRARPRRSPAGRGALGAHLLWTIRADRLRGRPRPAPRSGGSARWRGAPIGAGREPSRASAPRGAAGGAAPAAAGDPPLRAGRGRRARCGRDGSPPPRSLPAARPHARPRSDRAGHAVRATTRGAPDRGVPGRAWRSRAVHRDPVRRRRGERADARVRLPGAPRDDSGEVPEAATAESGAARAARPRDVRPSRPQRAAPASTTWAGSRATIAGCSGSCRRTRCGSLGIALVARRCSRPGRSSRASSSGEP
jgi:hypothetical protein